MVLIIDNYDSFVHTLARYAGMCGRARHVVRNDNFSVADILARPPTAILISPGPGKPQDAGLSVSLLQQLRGRVPVLGVCLGHQAIVSAYGGCVTRAMRPLHGRTALIRHNGDALFDGIDSAVMVGRYHSLIAHQVPACLLAIAHSEEGEVMAVRHQTDPLWGVQFHPESVLTPDGMTMMQNFFRLSDDFAKQQEHHEDAVAKR